MFSVKWVPRQAISVHLYLKLIKVQIYISQISGELYKFISSTYSATFFHVNNYIPLIGVYSNDHPSHFTFQQQDALERPIISPATRLINDTASPTVITFQF